MFMKIRFLLIISLCILVPFVSFCSAQQPQIKWSIDNTKALKVFWINEDLIGILTVDKFLVVNIGGKIVWELNENQSWNITQMHTGLKLLLPDGTLKVFTPNDGSLALEKKFTGQNLRYEESVDGAFAVTSQKDNSSELKVFSKSGELLWQILTKPFNLYSVLPKGKAVIGITYNKTNQTAEIKIINSKEQKLIKSIKDVNFFSGESGLDSVYNSFNKYTLLAVSTTPWWGIISNSGDILLEKNQMPILRTDLFDYCGLNFVFASSVQGGKVSLISDKGKSVWTSKNFDRPINSISGNDSYFAVSIGNSGYPGKVLLYTKEGKLVGSIDVPYSLSGIQISKSKPLVVGISQYIGIKLFDFTK